MMNRILRVLILAMFGAVVGCASSPGLLKAGASRDEVRDALGNPQSRVSEVTGDDAKFCLTLTGKRPELIEQWTYTLSGENESPRTLRIFFDQRGNLIASKTVPATQP
jgi:hypothetical protein